MKSPSMPFFATTASPRGTFNDSQSDNLSRGAMDESHHQFTWSTIFVGSCLGLIILFTLLGNGLVVMAVASFRRLRSVTNYFVVSLAVADLTVAILVMPYSVLFEIYGEWKFGWIFCYFWISCDVTCCTSSILHLCVIALDRYVAITEPLRYRSRISKSRALFIIAAVWSCSGAISFVPIYLGWFVDSSQMELYSNDADCGLFVNQVYAVISSTTSFYLPLTVMVVVYVKIYRIAKQQSKEIKRLEKFTELQLDQRLKKKQQRSNDSKAVKTLGTIMGLFCVCWLPFFIMYLVTPFCAHCQIPPLAISIITWLGYCNSFINPCVYAFLNRDFRQAFNKILFCRRKDKFRQDTQDFQSSPTKNLLNSVGNNSPRFRTELIVKTPQSNMIGLKHL